MAAVLTDPDGPRTGAAGWAVRQVTEIPTVADGDADDPDWYPLQHFFGFTTFGANVFAATRGRQTLVAEHDERSSDRVVSKSCTSFWKAKPTSGSAGEQVHATRGTVIAVTDPTVKRRAVARAPGTMLLAIGVGEGPFSSTWRTSHFEDVPRAEDESVCAKSRAPEHSAREGNAQTAVNRIPALTLLRARRRSNAGVCAFSHRLERPRPYPACPLTRCPVMCIRCEAETPNELCTYCATLTRIEAERGFILFDAYLRKWAAFERWLEVQAAPAVPASGRDPVRLGPRLLCGGLHALAPRGIDVVHVREVVDGRRRARSASAKPCTMSLALRLTTWIPSTRRDARSKTSL